MNKEFLNFFQNIHQYDMAMQICQQLLLKLIEQGLFKPHSKKDQPYIDAEVSMILKDRGNLENYILENYDEIRFRNHIRDKKDTLKSCEAYLAKRTINYKEINNYDEQ